MLACLYVSILLDVCGCCCIYVRVTCLEGSGMRAAYSVHMVAYSLVGCSRMYVHVGVYLWWLFECQVTPGMKGLRETYWFSVPYVLITCQAWMRYGMFNEEMSGIEYLGAAGEFGSTADLSLTIHAHVTFLLFFLRYFVIILYHDLYYHFHDIYFSILWFSFLYFLPISIFLFFFGLLFAISAVHLMGRIDANHRDWHDVTLMTCRVGHDYTVLLT